MSGIGGNINSNIVGGTGVNIPNITSSNITGDETYLEAFLEGSTSSISSLPHEIKRNLELMKDLDLSCS